MKKSLLIASALLLLQLPLSAKTPAQIVGQIKSCNTKLTKAQQQAVAAAVAQVYTHNNNPGTGAIGKALCELSKTVPLVIPQPYLTVICPICSKDATNIASYINLCCCGKVLCKACTVTLTANCVAKHGDAKLLPCPFCKQTCFTSNRYNKASCDVCNRRIKQITKDKAFKPALAKAYLDLAQAAQEQVEQDTQTALEIQQEEMAQTHGIGLPAGVHYDEQGQLAADPGDDLALAFVLQHQEYAWADIETEVLEEEEQQTEETEVIEEEEQQTEETEVIEEEEQEAESNSSDNEHSAQDPVIELSTEKSPEINTSNGHSTVVTLATASDSDSDEANYEEEAEDYDW